MEALDWDSGARDLSYSPNVGRDTKLHAKSLLRAVGEIYGIQPDDSHNYECLGSSGH